MKSCELCGREAEYLHRHHLIPRKFARKWQIKEDNIIGLCKDCNKMVHALFSLKNLAKSYNTLEKLKSASKISHYISWIRSRPVGIIKHPRRAWEGGKYD